MVIKICLICFRIAIAYCNLDFQAISPGTPKSSYIFKIGNIFIPIESKMHHPLQRILQRLSLSCSHRTTWCHVNLTPRTHTCWLEVATMAKCAGGMIGVEENHRERSIPHCRMWSQYTRLCGS